ncbi:MAG: cytidyltransferase [Rhodospirillaceae bacterium]|nr:MAG: cytidyltransferase [Rhodospirillaceae bacterium]
MTNRKIISLEQISEQSRLLKSEGKSIVLCHGTFDLMHTGHIRYLSRAKREGDVLLVTLTADEFVNKGPGRPVFKDELRAENLAALEVVDFVAIVHEDTAVETIHAIQPDLYVKGSEYRTAENDVTGNIVLEQKAVEEGGGTLFFTDEITFSSSNLLNEHFGLFPPQTKDYLNNFSKNWTDKDVLSMLDTLADLKVLVIGDVIVDEYHYVSSLGQIGKGNARSVEYKSEEQFAGGAVAVANHISGFVENVTLVSGLGDRDSHEDFIMGKLQENVTPVFARFKDAPTVTKRRFVDDDDLSKLFEVYYYRDDSTLENDGKETLQWLDDNIAQYDIVIAADFGNGFITDEIIQTLTDKSKFLAVNTQINSGNRGHHVITRYPRADFVSLNEPELRLAAHSRHEPLEDLCKLISQKLQVGQITITRGLKGVMAYDCKANLFHEVPALSSRVVDRIGAGDAFLALSALCFGKGMDTSVSVFVGAVAAAMDVQIVCNREPIHSSALKKFVTTLLK